MGAYYVGRHELSTKGNGLFLGTRCHSFHELIFLLNT